MGLLGFAGLGYLLKTLATFSFMRLMLSCVLGLELELEVEVEVEVEIESGSLLW